MMHELLDGMDWAEAEAQKRAHAKAQAERGR